MSVDYLTANGDRYSHFVHQSVASNDGYNADNEPLDEEDAHIASLADPDQQQTSNDSCVGVNICVG